MYYFLINDMRNDEFFICTRGCTPKNFVKIFILIHNYLLLQHLKNKINLDLVFFACYNQLWIEIKEILFPFFSVPVVIP